MAYVNHLSCEAVLLRAKHLDFTFQWIKQLWENRFPSVKFFTRFIAFFIINGTLA